MSNEITPEQRIDAAIDSVLNAGGLSLKHLPNQKTINAMRSAMLKIMNESYLAGEKALYKKMLDRNCG